MHHALKDSLLNTDTASFIKPKITSFQPDYITFLMVTNVNVQLHFPHYLKHLGNVLQ